METYDLIVIGSGPGGYPAAIKAAQEGLKVALIESDQLGGTCLNRGCIPSKALIACAEAWHGLCRAAEFGISVEKSSFEYGKMVERQEEIVAEIRGNLERLLKSNGVSIFRGRGSFLEPKEIKVSGEKPAHLRAEKILIASGSRPRAAPAFPCDGERIHDSSSLLKMRSLPKRLAVIGGGVIGVEFASMYNLLGVEVSVVELLPRLLSTECRELSSALEGLFEKRGVRVITEADVRAVERRGDEVVVRMERREDLFADCALVSIGRAPETEGLQLGKAALPLDEKGLLAVDEHMETEVSGVYAIGDVTGRWWLAHAATHQGLIAVDHMLGRRASFTEVVPSVVFTTPEIASVGLSPEKAKEAGLEIEVGTFPFSALGKALASSHSEGFAQLVAERESGQLLGAQVFGHDASSLIAEMALAIQNELTLGCLLETIHAHPSLSEVWSEAAFLASGKPLHLPPKRRRDAAS